MGRNYVHSLKSSSRIFIYFVVSLEEVWESVLHIFLKARLLALKKTQNRLDSKCLLIAGKAFTALHLQKLWALQFQTVTMLCFVN